MVAIGSAPGDELLHPPRLAIARRLVEGWFEEQDA
jgi:hypothetical protein